MAQSPDCYILAVQWTHDTCWAQNVPLLDSKMLQLRAAEAFYMSYPAWRCLRARMVAGRLGSTGAERFSKRSSVFLERASRALLPGPLTRAPRRSDICSSPCCPPAQPVQAIRSTPRKQGYHLYAVTNDISEERLEKRSSIFLEPVSRVLPARALDQGTQKV